ncbi:ArsR family transcriptional regulator [Arthrobacter sp. 24S4-2]|uniref:helix-turn-helix transcriptional regulator n=1 Tax=Arthrobacter sp. 24S4-2 TaxID=2575374 RepID=UPI0010C7CEBF|nr:helix-turn-helix domain-containing protein [Arthrobacter sp. 24S4-2]QCO99279.1 ArsR family transcriptional regulator [Arthrobacter sp. 24S4-2]
MPAGSEAVQQTGRSAPGSTRRNENYHAALASRTRRGVLDALARSSEPLDAQAIAGALELHVSTVRFHLDQLEEARLVRRESGGDRRRGRPRVLYAAVLEAERDEGSREQLIEVLAGALAHRDADQGRSSAINAGRDWARGLVAERSDSVDRRSGLLEVLDGLGFDPAPDGDVVQLRGCPFRDAARRHPQVVCSVHLGLVQQLLDGDGDAPPDVRLLPFVQPSLCVITLT